MLPTTNPNATQASRTQCSELCSDNSKGQRSRVTGSRFEVKKTTATTIRGTVRIQENRFTSARVVLDFPSGARRPAGYE